MFLLAEKYGKTILGKEKHGTKGKDTLTHYIQGEVSCVMWFLCRVYWWHGEEWDLMAGAKLWNYSLLPEECRPYHQGNWNPPKKYPFLLQNTQFTARRSRRRPLIRLLRWCEDLRQDSGHGKGKVRRVGWESDCRGDTDGTADQRYGGKKEVGVESVARFYSLRCGVDLMSLSDPM